MNTNLELENLVEQMVQEGILDRAQARTAGMLAGAKQIGQNVKGVFTGGTTKGYGQQYGDVKFKKIINTFIKETLNDLAKFQSKYGTKLEKTQLSRDKKRTLAKQISDTTSALSDIGNISVHKVADKANSQPVKVSEKTPVKTRYKSRIAYVDDGKGGKKKIIVPVRKTMWEESLSYWKPFSYSYLLENQLDENRLVDAYRANVAGAKAGVGALRKNIQNVGTSKTSKNVFSVAQKTKSQYIANAPINNLKGKIRKNVRQLDNDLVALGYDKVDQTKIKNIQRLLLTVKKIVEPFIQ